MEFAAYIWAMLDAVLRALATGWFRTLTKKLTVGDLQSTGLLTVGYGGAMVFVGAITGAFTGELRSLTTTSSAFEIGLLVFIGVAIGMGNIAMVMVYRCQGPLSASGVIIKTMSALFVIFGASVYFGDQVSILQYLGAGMSLSASWIIFRREPGHTETLKGDMLRRWLFWSLFAALMQALYELFSRHVCDIGAKSVTRLMVWPGTVMMLQGISVLVLARRKYGAPSIRLPGSVWLGFVVVMFAGGWFNYFGFRAYELRLSPIVKVGLGTGIIFLVLSLVGASRHEEKFNRVKVIAIVVAAISVVLLLSGE